MNPRDAVVGALAAAAIAALAWRAGALTPGGALAAFAVGTLTYGSGELGFALVLLAFFVPSVLLSRLGRARKRALVDTGKHGARDALQVLANGGVAAACAAGWAFTRDPRWAVAFAGAFAAATADTWATEIGTVAGRAPRSILTLRPMPVGLSGGITLAGTLAEIAGAGWIALVATIGLPVLAVAPIAIGGTAGATLDSVLGATLQELRRCDACGRTCETDPHVCGEPTRLVRGLRGFSNDLVNLLATAAGAAVAAALVP